MQKKISFLLVAAFFFAQSAFASHCTAAISWLVRLMEGHQAGTYTSGEVQALSKLPTVPATKLWSAGELMDTVGDPGTFHAPYRVQTRNSDSPLHVVNGDVLRELEAVPYVRKVKNDPTYEKILTKSYAKSEEMSEAINAKYPGMAASLTGVVIHDESSESAAHAGKPVGNAVTYIDTSTFKRADSFISRFQPDLTPQKQRERFERAEPIRHLVYQAIDKIHQLKLSDGTPVAHGDPHPGNVLTDGTAVRFIDVGPVPWDHYTSTSELDYSQKHDAETIYERFMVYDYMLNHLDSHDRMYKVPWYESVDYLGIVHEAAKYQTLVSTIAEEEKVKFQSLTYDEITQLSPFSTYRDLINNRPDLAVTQLGAIRDSLLRAAALLPEGFPASKAALIYMASQLAGYNPNDAGQKEIAKQVLERLSLFARIKGPQLIFIAPIR